MKKVLISVHCFLLLDDEEKEALEVFGQNYPKDYLYDMKEIGKFENMQLYKYYLRDGVWDKLSTQQILTIIRSNVSFLNKLLLYTDITQKLDL